MAQQLVEFQETAGGLQITLLDGARTEIEELLAEREANGWHADTLLAEVLEYQLCNSEWELLNEFDRVKVGALTSAPLLSKDIERDDNGDIIRAGRIYWYEPYEVFDPVEQLLDHGEVVFGKGWID